MLEQNFGSEWFAVTSWMYYIEMECLKFKTDWLGALHEFLWRIPLLELSKLASLLDDMICERRSN